MLGDFFLWFAHAIFSVLMYFIAPLAQMEWSSIHAAKPPGWHLVLACIGVVICIRPGILLESWISRFIGLLMCLSLWLPREYLPNHIPYGELEMTVWDIGQGNAVLIKTQSHQLLFDTGPVSFGKFDPAEKVIIPHLRASGIRNIDQLVISHQDADHIGGLGYLLKHFPIQRAMGSIAPDHQVQQIFKKNKVLLEKCQLGQSWSWDGIDFYVWHPQLQADEKAQYKSTKPNDMSCVIEARLKHHSIWLTGDVEKNAERLMIERLMEDHTELKAIQNRNVILMAPHHGSKTSSTPMLLEYLNPESAFSQTGYKNRYQHPHPDVVGRYQNQGIDLQDTVQTGAQIWRTQGSEITLRQYRKPALSP
jgi:competence protein ComEC